MVCPKCGKDNSIVIESKQIGTVRRRRYQCLECDKRFSTHEIPVHRVQKNKLPGVYVSADGAWISETIVPESGSLGSSKS